MKFRQPDGSECRLRSTFSANDRANLLRSSSPIKEREADGPQDSRRSDPRPFIASRTAEGWLSAFQAKHKPRKLKRGGHWVEPSLFRAVEWPTSIKELFMAFENSTN